MTTILFLALAGQFRFPGGSEQALVDAVANQLKRPVAMLAVSPEPRRAFEFRHDDETDVRRLLRVKSGLNVTPAGGLFPTAWPSGVGCVWGKTRYERAFAPFIPKTHLKDGRITLRTPAREAATLTDVAALGLSRPLSWPSFYDRARLHLSLENASEKELLTAVADATGTRLVVDKAGYRLITDPKQYRARALAMWGEIGEAGEREGDPVRVADAEYMTTFLPLTSDGLIRVGIDEPDGNYAETWAPGTPVHEAAWRRAAAIFRTNSSTVQSVFRHAAKPSDPVYGYIRDTGEARVGYRNVEGHEYIEL